MTTMTDAELEALVALGEGITPLERAKKVIAEQGEDLTLEQIIGQRDSWIISGSEWEARLVKAEARVKTLVEENMRLRGELARIVSFEPHEGDDTPPHTQIATTAKSIARQALSNMEGE